MTMNGEMLEELRRITRDNPGDIPAGSFQRLMLACMDEQMQMTAVMKEKVEKIEKQICDNPAYKLGQMFTAHPKLFTAVFVFIFLALLGNITILTGIDLSELAKTLIR